jgi:hypothetical protein
MFNLNLLQNTPKYIKNTQNLFKIFYLKISKKQIKNLNI